VSVKAGLWAPDAFQTQWEWEGGRKNVTSMLNFKCKRKKYYYPKHFEKLPASVLEKEMKQ